MQRFFLEVLDGSSMGRKVEVYASVTLGRSRGNDLCFDGKDAGIVSARHALVALKAQTLWLRDLDSTNGTFVGKTRVTERELLGGEIISLGPAGPAMRVLVSDAVDDSGNPGGLAGGFSGDDGTETLLSQARATTAMPISMLASMPATDMGLLSSKRSMNGGGNHRSHILEMAKRLRTGSNPQEVMQGLFHDPERLGRMLQGGVMPEHVAGWVGAAGDTITRQRKRIYWAGGVLGAIAFVIVSVLGYQNLSYRSKIKKQGNLLGQIHELEKGLETAPGKAAKTPAEKAKLVHQLLDAERQLFQIREKLRQPDRVPTYRVPLGGDIHQLLEELGKKGFIVPESFVTSVQEQIDFFTNPANRKTLLRCFSRKRRYETLIRQELARQKLPPVFFYIAMQESLLDSAALSGNDARGLWQMVPETARDYDLSVPEDWRTRPMNDDERVRPRLATRAAAKYLHQLYAEFGDAALVMAAYNAGGNKMRRVLHQIDDPVNDRDFWYLYRMGLMQDETSEYVPKIIAMILIDRNRAKYGYL